MSSGNKSVLIAVDERAEPSDITQLQQLEAQRSGEIARWLAASKLAGGFYSHPGMHSAYEPLADAAVPTDEVAHQCLSGLMVRPGTTFCAVDPGGAAFYQPLRAGLTSDDTPWVFGFSRGLNDAAQLTFSANGGPGIRWDIIECQAAADTVQSQALRQVFDEVAQVFNPLLVDKIQSSVFTFRIRRGVQGGGIPAISADWMPLAAVIVRTDSTSFADCDLYDIRPLTTDRCEWSARHPLAAPVGGQTTRAVQYEALLTPQTLAGVNGLVLQGYFRSQFGGYWSGGELRRNLPASAAADFAASSALGAELGAINFEDPVQRSAAFALTPNTIVTLGAFFPRGYPRWVRYSESALASNATTRLRIGGRYPQGCRGILAVINGPDGGGNIGRNGVISPTVLPAAFGETQSAWGQVVCYAVVGSAGTDIYPPAGSSVDQKYYWPIKNVTYAGASAPGPDFNNLASLLLAAFTLDALANPAANHSAVATFNPGNAGIPFTASALLVNLQSTHSLVTLASIEPTQIRADFGAVGGGASVALPDGSFTLTNPTAGTTSFTQNLNFWFPLRPNLQWDLVNSLTNTKLAVQWSSRVGNGYAATPVVSAFSLGYQL